jgi:hypothetical protein
MLQRFRLLAAVCALVCPLAVQAHSQAALTIRAQVIEATTEGPSVRGTMRLTVVHAGDQNLTGLQLRLIAPASGVLGRGVVPVGSVGMDATVVVTAPFRLDKAFMDSSDPLVVEAAYRTERDGNDVRTAVRVARDGGTR